MMKTVGIAMALAMLITTTPALADTFYKWVDAQGTTHYGSEPPPDQVASEPVRTYGGPERPEATTSSSRPAATSPSDATTSPAHSAAARGNTGNMNQELEERCAQLRKNLGILTNRPIVRVKNGQTGKMEVIDQQRRKRMLADARKGLAMCDDRSGGQ